MEFTALMSLFNKNLNELQLEDLYLQKNELILHVLLYNFSHPSNSFMFQYSKPLISHEVRVSKMYFNTS